MAHNPFHGSGQAGFPHPALALGNDAHAAQGIGMTDGRQGQPAVPTASASRSELLTRLNTRPARSPVNASTPFLRMAPHDSGPMWVATSHSYDFSIHYTSPA